MPYMCSRARGGGGGGGARVALDSFSNRERIDGTVPLDARQVIVLLDSQPNALDVAQRKGVAHRDIKPANIFVSAKAAPDRPR